MHRATLGFHLMAWLSAALIPHAAATFEITSDIPIKPVVTEQYLFYQHARVMEQQGIPARHEKFGDYAFLEILKRLRGHDMNVIAEWRPAGAKMHPYAFRIARKVKALIEKGVPAKNITVCGIDKGGRIALLVASYVGEPAVSYVILGGCPGNRQKTRELVEKFELMPNGRILSLYASDHYGSGSCAPLLDQAEAGMQFQELRLSSGLGQGVFYHADNRWIEPLVRWVRGDSLQE